MIANFAWQHMKAAVTFRNHVIALEAANLGNEFGSFFEDIRSYGSGCILSAAASLEALINECFIDPAGPLRGKLADFEAQFWGRGGIEWKPPLEKYQVALSMLGQGRLNEESDLFKEAWALVELRNALVHYKPTWDPDQQRKLDMTDVLVGRYEVSPFPDSGADFVTMRSMSASGMSWAVGTALRFMREFQSRTCLYENKFDAFWRLEG